MAKNIYSAPPTITVPANGRIPVAVGEATHIYCFDASNTFQIALNGEDGADFRKGRSFSGDYVFNFVDVINPHASDITVSLGFGKGVIEDRATVIEGTLVNKSGETIETLSPVSVGTTATKLFDIDTDATRRWICPDDDIYIGASGVTTTNGMPVKAGERALVETGAEVYGVASATVSTRLMQEKV